MMLRSAIFGTGLLIAGAMAMSAPAHALTMKECGDKYQAAKTANTLNGLSWNDFRKTQCTAATPAAAAPAAPAPAAPAATATKPAPAPAATTAAKPAPATTAVAGTFPTAIDPEFAGEPKTAKIKTCGKHWKALKAANQTNGMKWTGKGGYWSQCAAQLKAK